MSSHADNIAEWLRAEARRAGARGFALGLSGGIDSAVVARLCQIATPGHVIGVLLPCHSQPEDEADARLVAGTFEIPILRVELTSAFDAITRALDAAIAAPPSVDVVDIKQQLPRVNIKPRLRMTSLYFIANSMNYLVAGTGNRSEITLGYYTKYGDGGVDVLPIGNLLKSEVRALARELGVPAPVVDKPPTAGLWPGQTDEAEMGFTYDMLEQYLHGDRSALPATVVARIEQLHTASAHKRALPPIAMV